MTGAALADAERTLVEGRARHADAERAAGRVVFDLAVAGHAIRLHFAGTALVPRVVPALAHLLEPSAADPHLTVYLWDGASTGVPPLPSPAGLDGDVIAAAGSRWRASYRQGTGRWPVLDLELGVAVVCLGSASEIPPWDTGLPFLHLFQTYFGRSGLHVVHGAAVAGVLLGGRGGAGKSTTSLLCLDAGLPFAGDDHILLDAEAPRAYSLYRTGKVLPDGVSRFPRLAAAFAAAPTPEPGEKLIARLDGVAREVPLRAVALPHVSGRPDTVAVPMPPVHAVRALAASTILQLPTAGTPTLAALSRLCRQVPCYRLEVGTDLTQIPRAIARLGGAP